MNYSAAPRWWQGPSIGGDEAGQSKGTPIVIHGVVESDTWVAGNPRSVFLSIRERTAPRVLNRHNLGSVDKEHDRDRACASHGSS